MFRLSFELYNKLSHGLFHDSVDVTFSSGDVVPTNFNVFDFQGERANMDFELIGDLLDSLPFSYLLVQANSDEYPEQLFEAL